MKSLKPYRNSMVLISAILFIPACASVEGWRKPDDRSAMKHEMRAEMMGDMHACMKMMHQMHSKEKPMQKMDMKSMSEDAKQGMHDKMMGQMKTCMETREKVRLDGGDPDKHGKTDNPSPDNSEHQH